MKAKEKILQVAAGLFATKGYAETSADEIIMKSGISKGLLFYHYTNKDGLLTAVVDRAWEIIQQSCIIEETGNHAARGLRQLIKNMIHSLKIDTNYWKVYAAISLNPTLSTKLDTKLYEPTDAYKYLISDLFRKMEKKNPARWAFFFDIQFRGIYFGYIADPNNFPLDNAKQVMLDMFTR